MPKPNFFIVGAPRCGTTAMYEYLKAHPDIFMPVYDKEPHYFGSDLTSPRFARFRGNEEKYLRLFANAGSASRVGEGSVQYLYSRRAAQEIYDFNPDARIIIMLRNPIDMIYSLHSLMCAVGEEDITDFAEALAAEVDRKQGLRLPRGHYFGREMFLYTEVGQFSEQIERYWAAFGQDQVFIVIFDDFRANTELVYRQTLDFLGVDADFQTDLKRINANLEPRSKLLMKLLRNRRLAQITSFFEPLAMPVYVRLRAMNTREVQRPQLNSVVRTQLAEYFRPDVERLSVLLNRDLRHWIASESL